MWNTIQLDVVSFQLIANGAIVFDRIGLIHRRWFDQVNQNSGAFDMLEKIVAQSYAFTGAVGRFEPVPS